VATVETRGLATQQVPRLAVESEEGGSCLVFADTRVHRERM